jgi:hypothetical protein
VPLLLYASGAPKVYACDLSRLASIEQINHVIRQLRDRLPGDWPDICDLEHDLFDRYRIRYLAPMDARHTGFADAAVDFIYSTSVLEHVGEHQLDELLRECVRIASPRCVMSHNIGYIDHYAHADHRLSHFHFYRFGDGIWWLFNPSMQHQNRLRHSDFEAIFARACLRVARSERLMATARERTPEVPLHKKFKNYSEEDLFAHDGLFTLHCRSAVSLAAPNDDVAIHGAPCG